jgi:hypothetical protein
VILGAFSSNGDHLQSLAGFSRSLARYSATSLLQRPTPCPRPAANPCLAHRLPGLQPQQETSCTSWHLDRLADTIQLNR